MGVQTKRLDGDFYVMPRFHMKKNQSGAAVCTASERECPNGEFGHFESAYEVHLSSEEFAQIYEINRNVSAVSR